MERVVEVVGVEGRCTVRGGDHRRRRAAVVAVDRRRPTNRRRVDAVALLDVHERTGRVATSDDREREWITGCVTRDDKWTARGLCDRARPRDTGHQHEGDGSYGDQSAACRPHELRYRVGQPAQPLLPVRAARAASHPSGIQARGVGQRERARQVFRKRWSVVHASTDKTRELVASGSGLRRRRSHLVPRQPGWGA
jgi:hypothetical protein